MQSSDEGWRLAHALSCKPWRLLWELGWRRYVCDSVKGQVTWTQAQGYFSSLQTRQKSRPSPQKKIRTIGSYGVWGTEQFACTCSIVRARSLAYVATHSPTHFHVYTCAGSYFKVGEKAGSWAWHVMSDLPARVAQSDSEVPLVAVV